MPWGVAAAAVAATGSIIGAGMQADAMGNAANTQANAARQQQATLLAAGQQAAGEFQPYKDLGTMGVANQTANNAYFNNQFSNADLNANLSPNYAFQLGQGQQANLNASNATGGLVGGNALKGLQDYTQGYAGTAYQQAFNNYQAQRGNIAAQNNNLTNFGLSGATGSANAQIGTATNVAALGMSSANAQAASQIAQGQTYGNLANTLGNIGYGYASQQMPNTPMNSPTQFGAGIQNGSIGTGGFTPTDGNSFVIPKE